jgi:hypothetical protein
LGRSSLVAPENPPVDRRRSLPIKILAGITSGDLLYFWITLAVGAGRAAVARYPN